MFYICSAVQTAGEMAVPGAEWKEGQFYIGGVVAGAALDRVVGHVHRHRRAYRQPDLAAKLRSVLCGHEHDEGQPRLRRSQQR